MVERLSDTSEHRENKESEPIRSAKAITLVYNPEKKQWELVIFKVNYEKKSPFLEKPESTDSKYSRPKNPKWFFWLAWWKIKGEEDPRSAILREVNEEIGAKNPIVMHLGNILFEWYQKGQRSVDLFLVIIIEKNEENFSLVFSEDPDEEFNGASRIPLGKDEEEILKNLNYILTLGGTDFGLKSRYVEELSIGQVINDNLMEVSFWSLTILEFFAQVIKDNLMEVLTYAPNPKSSKEDESKQTSQIAKAPNDTKIIQKIAKQISLFNHILDSINSWSMEGIKEITLSEWPAKIIIPTSLQDNFTMILDLESNEWIFENISFADKFKFSLLLAEEVFRKAKEKGKLTNIHLIKIPREQWSNLRSKHRKEAEEIKEVFEQTIKRWKKEWYITNGFMAPSEKGRNHKRFVLIETWEQLPEEVPEINFNLFEAPITFPSNKFTLPLIEERQFEGEWKNWLKQVLNSYSPDAPQEYNFPEKNKFEWSFLDLPRPRKLFQGTLSEILAVLFWIIDNEQENFQKLSTLFSYALKFHRYTLGSKVPSWFWWSNHRRFNEGTSSFKFSSLREFTDFLNYGWDEQKVFKWTLLKIAYVILYYSNHIHPFQEKLKNNLRLKTGPNFDINEHLPQWIAQLLTNNESVTAKWRIKDPQKIILKLLRRREASFKEATKDLLWVSILVKSPKEVPLTVESIITDPNFENEIDKEYWIKIEIKGDADPGLLSNLSDNEKTSLNIKELKLSPESPISAITIQFKNESGLPIEIMISTSQDHEIGESGLSTHSLYDLVKVFETLTRLYWWLEEEKIITIIRHYLIKNPKNIYGNSIIEELFGKDIKHIIKQLQQYQESYIEKVGDKINQNLEQLFNSFSNDGNQNFSQFWEQISQDHKPLVELFINELADQVLGSLIAQRRIKARASASGKIYYSFGYNCEQMKQRYKDMGKNTPNCINLNPS